MENNFNSEVRKSFGVLKTAALLSVTLFLVDNYTNASNDRYIYLPSTNDIYLPSTNEDPFLDCKKSLSGVVDNILNGFADKTKEDEVFETEKKKWQENAKKALESAETCLKTNDSNGFVEAVSALSRIADKVEKNDLDAKKRENRIKVKKALELAEDCLKGDDLIDLLFAACNIYCVCYGPDRSGCNLTNRIVKGLSPKLYGTFSFILEQGVLDLKKDDLRDVNKDLDSFHPLLERPSDNEILRLSRKIIETIIAKSEAYCEESLAKLKGIVEKKKIDESWV